MVHVQSKEKSKVYQVIIYCFAPVLSSCSCFVLVYFEYCFSFCICWFVCLFVCIFSFMVGGEGGGVVEKKMYFET